MNFFRDLRIAVSLHVFFDIVVNDIIHFVVNFIISNKHSDLTVRMSIYADKGSILFIYFRTTS